MYVYLSYLNHVWHSPSCLKSLHKPLDHTDWEHTLYYTSLCRSVTRLLTNSWIYCSEVMFNLSTLPAPKDPTFWNNQLQKIHIFTEPKVYRGSPSLFFPSPFSPFCLPLFSSPSLFPLSPSPFDARLPPPFLPSPSLPLSPLSLPCFSRFPLPFSLLPAPCTPCHRNVALRYFPIRADRPPGINPVASPSLPDLFHMPQVPVLINCLNNKNKY